MFFRILKAGGNYQDSASFDCLKTRRWDFHQPIFDNICDWKRGIIICTATKVDYLQNKEKVTRENDEQKVHCRALRCSRQNIFPGTIKEVCNRTSGNRFFKQKPAKLFFTIKLQKHVSPWKHQPETKFELFDVKA